MENSANNVAPSRALSPAMGRKPFHKVFGHELERLEGRKLWAIHPVKVLTSSV